MKKINTKSHDLDFTQSIIRGEIEDANVYYKLLHTCIEEVVKNRLKNFEIFKYIQAALYTKYILALSKLFSVKSGEESLSKLIALVRQTPDTIIKSRLNNRSVFIRKRLKQERELFLKNYDNYINEIKRIKKEINPLRNQYIAHNFPLGKRKISFWNHRKSQWLIFAEDIFVQAMDGIGKDSYKVGNFLPNAFTILLKNVISELDKHRQTKIGNR